MKIILASDHAGFKLKQEIKKMLENEYELIDVGNLELNKDDDYPDFAEKAVIELEKNVGSKAILICGTGIGMSIKANRYKSVRAVLGANRKLAEMAVLHNNANVLCLGARTTCCFKVNGIIKAFLEAKFEGGRHERRVEKLN